MNLIDFIIHIDKYLGEIIQNFGVITYAILFMIIFCETGLVVTPFLPGDSLIFAGAAFAAIGSLNVWILYVVILFAAFLGDTVNYEIGKKIGAKIEEKENPKLIKKEYLERTHNFFEKHGGKSIVLARFVPIVRTFAPFVAGSGKMNYFNFLKYNLLGSVLWVSLCVGAGYFFGNIEFVKNNFSLVILAIVFVSVMPLAISILLNKIKAKKEEKE
ncbi:MAG: DedA family protein [Clostridia bacterium]|nr:DedA family protein [Clostridia bacterium]